VLSTEERSTSGCNGLDL